ncbi:hypothetical protein F4818DRAFT_446016 [Hypoxylon cercidicola]|nr:hypothetical protein F4818DRAFT_446016 [Hypoxylon cercidicola]
MADTSGVAADSPSKVTGSPSKAMNSPGKSTDSPGKVANPSDKMKESSIKWMAFADQFKELTISKPAPGHDPTHELDAYKVSNRDGDTHNAGKLANEEFIGGLPTRPIHFFRSDGKLFHRLFDNSVANKVDDGWDDDEIMTQPGYFARPTYTSPSGKARKEVNYARWKLVEAPKEDYDYLLRNYWTVESLLNTYDFNQPNEERCRLQPLRNLRGLPLSKIYPKGHQLLVKESKRGGPEWMPGQPLGLDPNNKENRTTHIGWVPPRFRAKGRGLGADPTDAVYKHWFFGDLDVPLPDRFVEPEAPWSKNPDRIVRMKSVVTKDNPASHEFAILSRESLKRKYYVPPKERAPEKRPSLPWIILRPRKPTPMKTNEAFDVMGDAASNKRRCVSNLSEKTAMGIQAHIGCH